MDGLFPEAYAALSEPILASFAQVTAVTKESDVAEAVYPDTIDASGRMIPYGTYRTWLGVPRHMYRACLTHVVGWLRAAFTGRSNERFQHELRIRSYLSFFRTRWATTWTAEPGSKIPRAIA